MYDILLAFVTAFGVTYFMIPPIIQVAQDKRLMDMPNERSSHENKTPSLGGIAIFAGLFFAVILWTPSILFGQMQYILAAMLSLFFIGARDDIMPLSPLRKFIGEIFAVSVLIFAADIRISSFYGLFDVGALPYWFSVLFSLFAFIGIINAFNFIDGINGLAGNLSVLVALCFGSWFYLTGHLEFSILSYAMVGSLIAFLFFNYSSTIFMGDSGSLIMGLICGILAIQFMEINDALLPSDEFKLKSSPVFALALLIIPIFDTIRVSVVRIMQGRSPFSPDRNHLHHMVLDSGFSHLQATWILTIVAMLVVFLVYQFQWMDSFVILVLLTLMMLTTSTIFSLWRRSRIKNQKA